MYSAHPVSHLSCFRMRHVINTTYIATTAENTLPPTKLLYISSSYSQKETNQSIVRAVPCQRRADSCLDHGWENSNSLKGLQYVICFLLYSTDHKASLFILKQSKMHTKQQLVINKCKYPRGTNFRSMWQTMFKRVEVYCFLWYISSFKLWLLIFMKNN